MKIAFVIMLAMAVSLPACSAKQATKAPERASASQPYDFEKEGTVPPPDQTEPKPEADVEEIVVEENDIVGEDVEAPKDTTKETRGGPGRVEGKDGGFALPVFRVQVLATTSEQSALDTKSKIEGRLGLPAYVAFEDGLYKVRVGDSPTRELAEKVRTKLRGAGYTDAWIVTDVLRGEPKEGSAQD